MTTEPTKNNRARGTVSPALSVLAVISLFGLMIPGPEAAAISKKDPGRVTATQVDNLRPTSIERVKNTTRDTPLESVPDLAPAFDPGSARIALLANGKPLRYWVQAIPMLPGEVLDLRIVDSHSGPVELRYEEGFVQVTSTGWQWVAPEAPGAYAVEVVAPHSDSGAVATVSITALVLHPVDLSEKQALNGYRLGQYMPKPLRGNPVYLPPKGLFEVPEAMESLAVSPHFFVGQFLCKQEGERKFLAFSPALATKLEVALEAVNAAGIEAETFHVMSGYRTPAYNRAIGNTTVYSRHLYGDAADIFIDVDGDERMDDLNRDGRVNAADAQVLYDLIEPLARLGGKEVLEGGLGLYGPKPHRGPFVHVDTRGSAARW